MPQHEPIVTAKAIASLDQLSGGRFIFGIGGGWNVEEMENHGAKYQTRFKQMREHVLAMKELWTKEEASFDGEFVKFDRVWSWPKPAQQPHPPIILGGETDHTLRRVIEYCDGWFPRPRGGFDVVKGVAHLRQMAEKAGRDPSTITTIVFGSANDAKVLESYDKAGIQSALLAIPDEQPRRDPALSRQDRAARQGGAGGMTVAIGLGLMEFPFAGAGDYWRWVDLCEAGGVDSLWQTDRLVSRQPILECMAVMAALAGRTRRLRFGMNVVSLALRDPVLLAKQCATIDVLSEGRLLPGFGIGSPLGPEWEALDIDTKTRGRRTDESLQIIARLWREDSVDFEGRHYRLKAASISPKPVQPDLPMWIGGSSEAAIRRTARYGTGWQSGAEQPDAVGKVVAAIKKAAAEAGRTIDEDHYGAAFPFYFGSPGDGVLSAAMAAYQKRTGRDPSGYFAIGDEKVILDRVAEYVAVGVEKFILRPVGPDGDAIIAQTRKLIDKVLPQVEARWPKKAERRASRSEGKPCISARRCSSPTTP